MITIYGIKNCDKCRNAIRYLEGRANFHDVRKVELPNEKLNFFIDMFGERILNTRSKTWKALDEDEKKFSILDLLKQFPTLMKRPLIESSDHPKPTIGWTEDIKKQYFKPKRL